MFKLANQILDAYDDVHKTYLRKVAKINPKINMMSQEDISGLNDYDFALSIITKKASKLNKFPVADHDSTWLSNEFFNLTHQSLPKQAAEIAAYHIKKACERYNITPTTPVLEFDKEAATNIYAEGPIPKSSKVNAPRELDLSKFAQVKDICDNYTFAQYAFPTATHIGLACKYFEKYAEKFPLDCKHKYAAAIQKRAVGLGLGQQKGLVAKYASDYYSGHVDAHLSARSSLLDVADPKYKDALNKLSAMKSKLAPSEFAKVLHGFDKRAGLTKYYDAFLTDPYRATFAQEPVQLYEEKLASGNKLNQEEISQVASAKYAKIKEYFGKDVADELKKHGSSIFESLPMDAKEIIAGIAHGTI